MRQNVYTGVKTKNILKVTVTRSLRFFLSHKDDLSLNKVATQSHIYLGIGYDANNAVDGNTATCMRTKAIGPNNPDKTVWWRVDLGGLRNIYSISVLFKNYNGTVITICL